MSPASPRRHMVIFKRVTSTLPGCTNHAALIGSRRTVCGVQMRGGKLTQWLLVVGDRESIECERCAEIMKGWE